MRNYNLDYFNQSKQLLKKYCLSLDKDIFAVQNYIDFKSPNYIELTTGIIPFYSAANLADLGILDDGNINTSLLYPGQIIVHNFNDEYDIDYTIDNNPDFILSNGYALLKTHSGLYKYKEGGTASFYIFTDYVISDSSDSITINCKWDEHAGATYGTTYTFTITPSYARFTTLKKQIIQGEEKWIPSIYRPNTLNWQNVTLTNWGYDDNHQVVNTLTAFDAATLWTSNLVISHEIFTPNGEEVICHDISSFGSQVFENKSQSFYTISTDLDNAFANKSGAQFFIVFY